MRRTDREVKGQDQILAILERCEVLRLGLCDGGQPYIVPMNFAYVEGDTGIVLYFHSALEGRKIDIIRHNNRVCFEGDCDFGLIRGSRACDWSAEYASVIGEGTIELVQEEKERQEALGYLMRRYGFTGELVFAPKVLQKTAVLKIKVSGISGKQRKKQ